MTDEYQIDTTTVIEENASSELLALLDKLDVQDTTTDPSANGEIRRNGTDVKVYSGGSVKNLSNIGSGSTSPGGSDTQLQYNNSGSFGGISDLTYDGTNLTSLTDLDTVLTLLDQAADPSANGEIQLNGSDIKAYSGGQVRNLSNIGSGGTGTDGAYDTVSTVTSAYTASDNEVVLADVSGGAFDVTLPSATEAVETVIKKTDSSTNAVTIATPGAETIDGQNSITISNQYASRTITSDGSNYFIL